jgi:riboflavin synthase
MFSGIIESLGQVEKVESDGSNLHFYISCDFIDEVYIDQSIAHDGVCLTVVEIILEKALYKITAIEETLHLTSLKNWEIGTLVNIERCLKAGDRLDGHFVQGHVDTTTRCIDIEEREGSWYFSFELGDKYKSLVVNKGSITINGISLTAILDEVNNAVKVAIIPYTFEHTNFKRLRKGDIVNLEFDILGKYVLRAMEVRNI